MSLFNRDDTKRKCHTFRLHLTSRWWSTHEWQVGGKWWRPTWEWWSFVTEVTGFHVIFLSCFFGMSDFFVAAILQRFTIVYPTWLMFFILHVWEAFWFVCPSLFFEVDVARFPLLRQSASFHVFDVHSMNRLDAAIFVSPSTTNLLHIPKHCCCCCC